MTLEQLREQFLVDDDVPNEKLEQLIEKALPYCVVRKNGSSSYGAQIFPESNWSRSPCRHASSRRSWMNPSSET